MAYIYGDPCTLRRSLVEARLLERERDGSAYWLSAAGAEAAARAGAEENTRPDIPAKRSAKRTIRPATPEDAPALLAIYAPYVENTSVSFEYAAPSREEFEGRIRTIQKTYPYLVYLEDGRPMGYAYASRAQVRAAYGWNAEASVYLREDCHGKGIGRALYTALLEILQMQRIQTVYAVITSPNEKSERFHTRMGFVPFARFPRTGFKQGAWRDVTWMQRSIGGYEVPPAPVIPVTGLPEGQVAGAIARAQALLSDTAAE